ncbi:MAG TPA: serine/threonine-protein kinase [Polyangiaceae bacterium]
MAVTVSCEACGRLFAIPDDLYDKKVRGRIAGIACRGCGNRIRVDGTNPPPATASAPPPPEIPKAPAVPNDGSGELEPLSTRAPLTKIGRYTLFDQFASGGMATVHLGRLDGAGGFSRVVAIKRLLPHLVQNEDFTQMLLKEARLAARVRHPNVVPTLDVVASKGDVLLVLEYVHGEALSTLCRSQVKQKKDHIPVEVAVTIMRDVLQGLHAVHEATDERGRSLGLVHRDISPPNVLVGVDGLSRVLDFGIAKALEHVEQSDPNRVKGKTGYLSPEQIRGERLTQRSDVFSAGIILWEMLATRRLFSAEAETDRMQAILRGDYPHPRATRSELSEALDGVVMRALALEPEKRFESPGEFAAAIDAVEKSAAPAKVAGWVNELAAEALAARSRLLAQVETWVDAAGEIPLSSRPFAAEVPMTRTPSPPPIEETQPLELRRRSDSPTPEASDDDEERQEEADRPSSSKALALLLSIAAAVVVAYLASR